MGIKEYIPTNYPSDMTDGQWELIAEYFPQGPNSRHHKRSLVNAVLYLKDNGIKWRSLPKDYPHLSKRTSLTKVDCTYFLLSCKEIRALEKSSKNAFKKSV